MIPTELTIVTIGAFVAALNQATKYIATNFIKHDISKFIPICSVIYGLALGIIGFYLPNANMGSNLVEAIFIGISAGSASTGCHQIVKQLTKPVEPNYDELDNNDSGESINYTPPTYQSEKPPDKTPTQVEVEATSTNDERSED